MEDLASGLNGSTCRRTGVKEIPVTSHGPGGGIGEVAGSVGGMGLSEDPGQQNRDRLADQLLPGVAEQLLCLRVDELDRACLVHDDDGIGHRLDDATKPVVGSRAPGDVLSDPLLGGTRARAAVLARSCSVAVSPSMARWGRHRTASSAMVRHPFGHVNKHAPRRRPSLVAVGSLVFRSNALDPPVHRDLRLGLCRIPAAIRRRCPRIRPRDAQECDPAPAEAIRPARAPRPPARTTIPRTRVA